MSLPFKRAQLGSFSPGSEIDAFNTRYFLLALCLRFKFASLGRFHKCRETAWRKRNVMWFIRFTKMLISIIPSLRNAEVYKLEVVANAET